MYQHMHVQNQTHTNKSRHTHVPNINHQLLSPVSIENFTLCQ